MGETTMREGMTEADRKWSEVEKDTAQWEALVDDNRIENGPFEKELKGEVRYALTGGGPRREDRAGRLVDSLNVWLKENHPEFWFDKSKSEDYKVIEEFDVEKDSEDKTYTIVVYALHDGSIRYEFSCYDVKGHFDA